MFMLNMIFDQKLITAMFYVYSVSIFAQLLVSF